MSDDAETLSGGNVAACVLRIGHTVRKPATAASDAVHALLAHFEAQGLSGAPRSFGRDAEGRHVFEYIPGDTSDTLPAMTTSELDRVGALIRSLHDAADTFVAPESSRWTVAIPPDREDLICHHDLAPWNLVRNDERWVFIDWDGAGPGSRLWDLAYAAQSFVPLQDGGRPDADGPGLRALIDGYGLSAEDRARLPQMIVDHTRAMHDLLVSGAQTGEQPWARLHAEGHADYWGPAADYIERHLGEWAKALQG